MASPEPTILHVDMDAFYASVEIRDAPELSALPVAVGGKAEERGVIAAASYESRRYGVRSAMPTARAFELCQELVLLPPDFDKYASESRRLMTIFRRYTPLVEPVSLDEAYLDVSGCERLFGSAEEIAVRLKRDVLRETGLVASIGVAPSKFLAKLGSDLCKPDGLRVIRAEDARALLDPLPVERIHGVGERTGRRLRALGIATIGDLARLSRDDALARFGATGAWIHELAHGIDVRRVQPDRPEKSHGMERTFPADVEERAELRPVLLGFCERVAYDLRDRGLRGRRVAVKARYWNVETVTRTRTLEFATNLGARIYAAAGELLERIPPGPLRLLGVQVSGLEDVRVPAQGTLFELGEGPSPPARDQRLERVLIGLDRVQKKHGRVAAVPASLIEPPPRGARPAARVSPVDRSRAADPARD